MNTPPHQPASATPRTDAIWKTYWDEFPLEENTTAIGQRLFFDMKLTELESELTPLLTERDALKALLTELNIKDVKCTCGSGGHPRKCERHPWRYDMHVAEINLETAKDWDEDNARLEREKNTLIAELDSYKTIAESVNLRAEATELQRDALKAKCDECKKVAKVLARAINENIACSNCGGDMDGVPETGCDNCRPFNEALAEFDKMEAAND